ncbi:MAG: rhomboid family intramembrane serine protease [Candidatus Hydrogenedentota bacterium]
MLGYRIFRMLGIVFPESANPVTFSFLGVIMAFFLLGVVRDGFIGAFNPPRDTLAIFGMYQPAQVLRTWEFWRLMSFGLLHAGIIHLFFNGFAVSQVGPIIESHIGRSRMLVLITLGQLGAAVATHLWYFEFRHSNVPTVGASGWLFALIGYGIGGAQHFGVRGFVMRSFFLQWAMYGFLFGLFMGANNAAHFGGFAAGYLLGFVPIRQIPGRFTWNRVWMTAAGISGVIWVLTLGFMALSIGTQWNVRQ